jgi:Cytidylate kinase
MTRPRLIPDLAEAVHDASPRLGRVRLVCVDGPAGSGKTTVAAALAEDLAAVGLTTSILHLDDLYEGWSGMDGVWDRLAEQVLRPLEQGRPGRWQRYDWETGQFAEWIDLPVPECLVVEGCGSAPRRVDGSCALIAWVEVPIDLRLARGLARDGEHMRDHWVRWMADEAEVFATEGTRDRADVIVDGRESLS